MADAEAGLDEDLNTPVALAALGEMARHGHELADLAQKRRKDAGFVGAAGVVATQVLLAFQRITEQLGLLRATPAEYRARTRERRLRLRGLTADDIQAKVAERTAARAAKDFARSDALRAELLALGVSLHDGPEGTEWVIEQ
jgi:cysteinyl-tRNA synthetase